jgi:hypothetical protein
MRAVFRFRVQWSVFSAASLGISVLPSAHQTTGDRGFSLKFSAVLSICIHKESVLCTYLIIRYTMC